MLAYLPSALSLLVLLALWVVVLRADHRGSLKLEFRAPRRQARPPVVEPRPPRGTRGPMAWALVKWVLLAVLLAAATGCGLYWLLGRPALPVITAFTTAELLDLLKIGLAVVGGLGGVVALAVGYRKQQLSEAAHVIATRQEQRERTKFFNERYGQAAEQLGHDSFAVRLAGVYAMVGLADDWPEQRQICVDVLCGYLRTPYPAEDRTEREVRQEIINTLLDRVWERGWDSETVRMDFRGVEFEDLDLSNRVFQGNFTFDGATFHGARANFSNARFTGGISFRGARFTAAVTSFVEVSAKGATLDFSEAEFTGELLDFSTAELTRSTVDLTGAVVRGTTIRFYQVLVRVGTIALDAAELQRSTVDFSMVNLMKPRKRRDEWAAIGLRAVEAEDCVFRFGGSRFTEAEIRLADGRFTGCSVEADGVTASGLRVTAEGAEPAGFVEALRRMKNAGSPQAPGVPAEPQ
ncbi:pentapeptide repeat-containing protein [Saccharothrix coeruleofusca]|uniref:Pentapeptide repeat protein n=1 Tax=Saccharothrix coeruleofusca TaxID=33919 RepID=A0A918AHV6_9PSEU|nr:pentapeptide repeat-containing protein [Saccharothrix coeruleofusca]GGP39288.1 hypothetical protein GCM10010185_08530 [Saccharothrix coeruleofusca]